MTYQCSFTALKSFLEEFHEDLDQIEFIADKNSMTIRSVSQEHRKKSGALSIPLIESEHAENK